MIGGIPFFLSLLSLIYFGSFNLIFLLPLIDQQGIYNFMWFFAGTLLGAWASNIIIYGHISVLLHELKHSVVSNLVGNKFVSFHIEKEEGLFKYKHSKQSAKYNAKIALAPYFLPLFTAPGLLIVLIAYQSSLSLALLALGLFYGSDTILNLRDIGDHQTDFTKITGGFYVGLTFVIFMNLSIFTLITSWVLHQSIGIKLLFHSHFVFWTSFLSNF